MQRYLIDANLPYYFKLWDTDAYVHQSDINPSAKDREIWAYAEQRNLTIISKDSDFSNRIILKSPPLRVIHIRIGNATMKEFHKSINTCWEEVLLLIETHKLVNVLKNRIEAIR